MTAIDGKHVPPTLLRPEPALMHVADAAKILGISRATAYRLVASGELASVRMGTAKTIVRVPRAALMRYIECNTSGGNDDHAA